MLSLKKIARKFLYPALMELKFDQFLRCRSNNQILNIMYHGVVENDSTHFSPRHITRSQFVKQIKYLSEAELMGYKYQLAVDYKHLEDSSDLRILNRHGSSSTTTYESNIIMMNKVFSSKGV